MNAFPAELLNHHYACMLVGGLLPPRVTPSPAPDAASSVAGPSNSATRAAVAAAATSSVSEHVSVPTKSSGTAPDPPDAPASSASELHPAATPSSPPAPPAPPPPTSSQSTPPSASTASTAIADAPPTSTPTTAPAAPSTAFPQLCADLVDVLSRRGRPTAWDVARGRSTVFHSVLVDNNVRLPPRKTRLVPRSVAAPMPVGPSAKSTAPASTTRPDDSAPQRAPATSAAATAAAAAAAASNLPARSPLSPLHPSSPLYPDGLIAPVWVRKHTELVPSVFVSFRCLPSVKPPPPLAPNAVAVTVGQELKARDEELIRDISERKRTLTERGIKLTVVLVTTREMLDSPMLEGRLSYIRRSSGLDSKASLFVLTPVTKAELGEFVTSLQTALHDAACDYYREHARQVRRKRGRYPPPASVVAPILSAFPPTSSSSSAAASSAAPPPPPTPLSREGWSARAEFKLGTFAELGASYAEALTHYESAYSLLVHPLLGSTLHLPPRTKRWAEAKVLSDTLCVRIARLHLYESRASDAEVVFKSHLARLWELSTGWGIGQESFEWWSWLAKQYRLMGDLVDLALRPPPLTMQLAPLQLPIHAPPIPPFLLHPDSSYVVDGVPHPQLLVPNEAALASGVAPAEMLGTAGSYYLLAALCAEERRTRFLRMAAEERESVRSGSHAASTRSWGTLEQEKKVDHLGQLVETLGRAHELLRRGGSASSTAANQPRASSYVASRLLSAYHDAGKHEAALTLAERLAKPMAREGWSGPLTALLLAGVASSQRARLVVLNRAATAEVASTGGGGDSGDGQQGRALDGMREAELRYLAMLLRLAPRMTSAEQEALRAAWRSLGESTDSAGSQVAGAASTDSSDSPPGLRVTMAPGRGPLLVRVVHLRTEAVVGDPEVAFQVQLQVPATLVADEMSLDRIELHLVDELGATTCAATVERDEGDDAERPGDGIIHLGRVASARRGGPDQGEPRAVKARLGKLRGGELLVLAGALAPERPGVVRLDRVVLRLASPVRADVTLQVGSADGDAALPPSSSPSSSSSSWSDSAATLSPSPLRQPRWVVRLRPRPRLVTLGYLAHPGLLAVRSRPVRVELDVSTTEERMEEEQDGHAAARGAYVDEAVPIYARVRNADEARVRYVVEARLGEAETDAEADAVQAPAGSADVLRYGDRVMEGATLVDDAEANVLEPGEERVVVIELTPRRSSGRRSVEVVVRAREASSAAAEPAEAAETTKSTKAEDAAREARPTPTTVELAKSVNVEAQTPFLAEFRATWRRPDVFVDARSTNVPPTPVTTTSQGARGRAVEGSSASSSDDEDATGEGMGAESFSIQPEGPPTSCVASLHATIHCVAREVDALRIEAVALRLDERSPHVRWLAATAATPRGRDGEHGEKSGVAAEADAGAKAGTVATSPRPHDVDLGGEWRNGDRLGKVYEIEVLSDAVETEDGSVRPTGWLEVTWSHSRAEGSSSKSSGASASQSALPPRPSLFMSRLRLPVLLPPHLSAQVIVAAPPVVGADSTFVLLLTAVNPHSSLTADVWLSIDTSPHFSLVGAPRTLSIPNLVPRSTRSIPLRMVAHAVAPKSATQQEHGSANAAASAVSASLPRIRAWDRRTRHHHRAPPSRQDVGAAPSVATSSDQDGGTAAAAARGATMEPAEVVNSAQGLGIPLLVRYRHSTGAGIAPAAAGFGAALDAGHGAALGGGGGGGRAGGALSILVLPRNAGVTGASPAGPTGATALQQQQQRASMDVGTTSSASPTPAPSVWAGGEPYV